MTATKINPFLSPPPKAPSSGQGPDKFTPSVDWKAKGPDSNAILMVGSTSTATSLQRLFTDHVIPLDVQTDSTTRFGRDSRVCLLDKSHLLPFPVFMGTYQKVKFDSMLPVEESHFLDESQGAGYGLGFSEKNLEEAHNYAKVNNIKYRWAETCIEGGNCRIFIGKDGKPKAFLGVHSLILSYLALEQQGYFRKNEDRVERLAHRIDFPKDDSYRIARNLLLARECNDTRKPFPSKRKLLSKPAKPEAYYQQALDLEAKLRLTKIKIAEELIIPEDQIAFLIQENFHIDLDVFAGPDDVGFVHDEEMAISFLRERLTKGIERERPLLESYLTNAHYKLDRSLLRREKNQKAIESIGCRVVRISGDFFDADSKRRINFMNGVLLNDRDKSKFLTNGASSTALSLAIKSQFVETTEEESPNLAVLFVDDQNTRLPRSLGEAEGGLNCLTWIARPIPNPSPEPEPDSKDPT